MKIVIIGSGMMGSALSLPASDNGHEVHLVGTHLDREIIAHQRATGRHLTMDRDLPRGVRAHHLEELENALPGADFVICGVSSFGLQWFAETILPRLPEGLPVLAVTKGLLHEGDGKLICYPEYFERVDGTRRSFYAIGGPCTSYELADRQHSHVAFCGRDMAGLRMLRRALSTDYYHISLSTDVIGVESAVALKNAYALAVTLAVGVSEKMGQPQAHNPQAALFQQSVREMQGLLHMLNAGDSSQLWSAGDLYVTVFGGRTRKLGSLLGQGLTIDEALKRLSGVTLESVVITGRMLEALESLDSQGKVVLADYPLLRHVGQLLKGKPGPIPFSEFEKENY